MFAIIPILDNVIAVIDGRIHPPDHELLPDIGHFQRQGNDDRDAEEHQCEIWMHPVADNEARRRKSKNQEARDRIHVSCSLCLVVGAKGYAPLPNLAVRCRTNAASQVASRCQTAASCHSGAQERLYPPEKRRFAMLCGRRGGFRAKVSRRIFWKCQLNRLAYEFGCARLTEIAEC